MTGQLRVDMSDSSDEEEAAVAGAGVPAGVPTGRPRGRDERCPVVEIPGFTYPVKEHYLDEVMRMLGRDRGEQWWDDNAGGLDRARGGGVGGGDSTHATAAQDRASNPLARNHRIDYGTVAQLIAGISSRGGSDAERLVSDDGAVLVFLPGVGEIRRLSNELQRLNHDNSMWVLGCHGGLTSDDQVRAACGCSRSFVCGT